MRNRMVPSPMKRTLTTLLLCAALTGCGTTCLQRVALMQTTLDVSRMLTRKAEWSEGLAVWFDAWLERRRAKCAAMQAAQ